MLIYTIANNVTQHYYKILNVSLQFAEVVLLNIWKITNIARSAKYRFTKVGRC